MIYQVLLNSVTANIAKKQDDIVKKNIAGFDEASATLEGGYLKC